MKKEVFNQIVVDNIDSTLMSVTLSGGIKLGQELMIEGNRTTRTNVTFIKIEDTYVAIRKHTEVSYDYSGQIHKGDSRNADFYMGYEDIIAMEFYDEIIKPIYGNEVADEKASKQEKHEIIKKDKGKISSRVKKKNATDELFIKTAGDIGEE